MWLFRVNGYENKCAPVRDRRVNDIWSEIESFYAKRDFMASQTIVLTTEAERHYRVRSGGPLKATRMGPVPMEKEKINATKDREE